MKLTPSIGATDDNIPAFGSISWVGNPNGYVVKCYVRSDLIGKLKVTK